MRFSQVVVASLLCSLQGSFASVLPRDVNGNLCTGDDCQSDQLKPISGFNKRGVEPVRVGHDDPTTGHGSGAGGGKGGGGGSTPESFIPGESHSNGGGSGHSSGDESAQSKMSTYSARFRKVAESQNSKEEMNKMKMPEEYEGKGKEVLNELNEALKNGKEVSYPKISEHYDVRSAKTDPLDEEDYGKKEGMEAFMGMLKLDPKAGNWHDVAIFSKGHDEPVFSGLVSKEQKSVIAMSTFKSEDKNTKANQLPMGEIFLKAFEHSGGKAKDLKFIGQYPIANAGSNQMVRDAYHAIHGPKKIASGATTIVDPKSATMHNGLLGAPWEGTSGVPNTKPTIHTLVDHPKTMGKRPQQVHIMPSIPASDNSRYAALGIELSDA